MSHLPHHHGLQRDVQTQPPVAPPGDDLDAAKLRLLAAGEQVHPVETALHRHPLAAAGVAVVAGLMISRMPAMRKILGLAAAWGAKKAVRQYLARRMGA